MKTKNWLDCIFWGSARRPQSREKCDTNQICNQKIKHGLYKKSYKKNPTGHLSRQKCIFWLELNSICVSGQNRCLELAGFKTGKISNIHLKFSQVFHKPSNIHNIYNWWEKEWSKVVESGKIIFLLHCGCYILVMSVCEKYAYIISDILFSKEIQYKSLIVPV